MSDAPDERSQLNRLSDNSVDKINSFLRPSWDFSCVSKVCLYDTRTREEVHSIPVDSPVVDVACSSRFLAIALQNNKILFYKDLDGDYDGHDARFREKLDAELSFSQQFRFGEFDTKNRRTIIFSPLGTTFAVRVYRDSQPTILVYRLEENSAGNYSFEPVVEYPDYFQMVYTSDDCLAVVGRQDDELTYHLAYKYFNTGVNELYTLSRHQVEFVECFDNRVIVGTKNAENRNCIAVIKDGELTYYDLGFKALCAIRVDESKIALGGPDFIRELEFDYHEGVWGERMSIDEGYHAIFKLPNGSDEDFIIGTDEEFHWCNSLYNTKDTTEFSCKHFCGAVVEEAGETLMVVSGYSPPVRKAIEELIKMEIETGDRYMLRDGEHVSLVSVWDFIINTLTTYKSMFEERDWKNIINRGRVRVDQEWRMFDKDTVIYQAAGHGAFKVMRVLVETLDADVDDRCIFNLLNNIEETRSEPERVQRYLACIQLCMSIKPKVTLGKQILFQDWGPVNFDVISYAVYVCAEDALKELLNNTKIRINLPQALFAAVNSGDFFSSYEYRYKSMIKSILDTERCNVNSVHMVGERGSWTPISYVISEYVDGATELENLAMLLVDHGALNMGGGEPYPPFVYAINKGMVDLVEHWVDKDAEILNSVVSDRIRYRETFLKQLVLQVPNKRKAQKMLDILTKKREDSAGSGPPKESELMNNIILRF